MEHSSFHFFAYGSLREGHENAHMLEGCAVVGPGSVNGTLYDLGDMRVLMLYGDYVVPGTVWRCPAAMLSVLDDFEGVDDGMFRRIGANVRLDAGGEAPCWLYVAGPRLASRLTPAARVIASSRQPGISTDK